MANSTRNSQKDGVLRLNTGTKVNPSALVWPTLTKSTRPWSSPPSCTVAMAGSLLLKEVSSVTSVVTPSSQWASASFWDYSSAGNATQSQFKKAR